MDVDIFILAEWYYPVKNKQYKKPWIFRKVSFEDEDLPQEFKNIYVLSFNYVLMTVFKKIYYVKQYLLELLILNTHKLNTSFKNAVCAFCKSTLYAWDYVEAWVTLCV